MTVLFGNKAVKTKQRVKQGFLGTYHGQMLFCRAKEDQIDLNQRDFF